MAYDNSGFEVVKDITSVKVTDKSILKISLVKIKGQAVIGIREFVTTEKYSGPTKHGLFLTRAVLNEFNGSIWLDCLAELDKAEGVKQHKTKKSPKK
jgi:hypothetical protein